MTVKEILTPIIEQEFRKYENNGYSERKSRAYAS